MPSLGGHSCCFEEQAPIGPADQAAVEDRRDVLVYTSAPLDGDLVLAGPVTLRVYVDTDAPCADYVATLCTLGACGSLNIARGVARVTLPVGGGPHPVEIELRHLAARLPAGSRLRLGLTGGSFPMYDTNPQSAVPAARATLDDLVPATHVVYHDPDHPSALRLVVAVTP